MAAFQTCSTDPMIYGIRRVDELINRVCLTLVYSDPGRILSLLRSLYENSSEIIQMKINKYLTEVTKSDGCAMVMTFQRKDEYRISVMGERILPLEIYLNPNSEMIKKWNDEEQNYLEMTKASLDSKLKVGLEVHIAMTSHKDMKAELSNLLVVPIRHPVNNKTIFYVLLIHPKKILDYKRICTGLVVECMRYCEGIVINSESFAVEKLEHERARNFIQIMQQVLLNIEKTDNIIEQIRLCVCDIMDAERCSIFLKDECGRFTSKILDYGERIDLAQKPLKNVTLPDDFGLMGIVGKTGKFINCCDAENDPRYCTDLDEQMKTITRTALCFPLIRNKTDVVGVVEVYNKVHSWKTHVFTDADEHAAEALSILLTPVIFHSLNFKKLQENMERRRTCDELFCKKQEPTEGEVEETVLCEVIHDYNSLMHFNYSQLTMDDNHLACVVYDMINNFGLVRRFDIRPKFLLRFIMCIFKDHPKFPFHNWRHTFGTFHFAAVLVNELNLVKDGYCTHIEVLALLLASLCHCATFRGSLSSFQISCGTTLGALYSSPAHINQQFQTSQAFRLLNRADTNILENISEEQYKIFAHLFKKLVNVSDIGRFLDKWERISAFLGETIEREDLEQRLCLISLLMGCSVLNDYSKDFAHCRRTAEMTYAEFLPAVERPHARGVFTMDEFTPTIELIPHLQIQFINAICLPAFHLLSQIFPVSYPCYERCLNNVETWVKYQNKFQQILEEELAEKERELQHAEE